MKINWRLLINYFLIYIIMYYCLIPLANINTGLGILVLLLAIPALIFILSFLYGKTTHKIDLVYLVMVIIVYIPTVFMFMNESALFYILPYLIIALFGNFFGSLIKKKTTTKK